jgi:CheY-like chemotaxis protein/anti-sigma regulatory factor (Ser/Thr protein kinase)
MIGFECQGPNEEVCATNRYMKAGTLLIADDNVHLRTLVSQGLRADGYQVIEVGDGPQALEQIGSEPIDVLITDIVMPTMSGIELLERARAIRPGMRAIIITGHGTKHAAIEALKYQACDFISKPFELGELRSAIENALSHDERCKIDVVSAKPDWIELRVPCDMSAVGPILKFMNEVEGDLPAETREAIGSAFREMLSNAIEHGGKLDPDKYVEVKYIRLKRAVLYSIKDPGEGFSLGEIQHAAVKNPDQEPLHHMKVRQDMGLRPGGYGILLASQVIDELVYNEKHNELIFVKYLG